MTQILNILAVVATLVIGTATISGSVLASPDDPFYPDGLKNQNLPHVGVGSGIPPQYRAGG